MFAALTEHDQALAGAIVGANRTFGALASESDALAETFKIFPTFENEGRLTLDRLKTSPRTPGRCSTISGRWPAISPTLRDVRRLAPKAKTVPEPRSADQGLGDRAPVAEQLPPRAAPR